MDISNSAGAARPLHRVLRALTAVALLFSPWLAATAAPVLSGTPATSVTAAHYYVFQPGVMGTAARKPTFAIANKPAWAQFDTGTGRLYGTPVPPAAVGTFTNISISASDGATRTVLPSFSIKVLPLPNAAPVLSGAPGTSVTVGRGYSFTPVARDPNGLRLAFAIANKPAWAVFDFVTGALSGNPTAANVGTYRNIVITVYDGYAKAQLPPFSITVLASGAVTPPSSPVPPVTPSSPVASATLSWTPPTQTTLGTPLTNLAGYRIRYGTTPSLGQTVTLANPGLTRYVIGDLTPATWYFQLTAYDKAGVESPPTGVESLIVKQ
jgi:hypothetical protein